MFTAPKLFLSKDLSVRCYLIYTYKGKRLRLFSGQPLNIDCNPNRCHTFADRQRELNRLAGELYSALSKGWDPTAKPEPNVVEEAPPLLPGIGSMIRGLVDDFEKQHLSDHYKRDLRNICRDFKAFLIKHNLMETPPAELTTAQLEKFLSRYNSSGTYYMNKRTTLSAVFARLVEQQHLTENPVPNTKKAKRKEVLNEAYSPEEMVNVLQHLQANHPNLYLCALMTYGTVLRPHKEIRLLRRKHLSDDLTKIVLGGKENKGGRVRITPITEYIRQALLDRGVQQMHPDDYIFTGNRKPFNKDYFTTAWSRQKLKMLKAGIIRQEQTLYSFRHTAAVTVFTKTQSLRMLQGMFEHASPDVSLKYLRSLGISEMGSAEDMPQLPESKSSV